MLPFSQYAMLTLGSGVWFSVQQPVVRYLQSSWSSEFTIKIVKLFTTGRGMVNITPGHGVTIHIFLQSP